MNILLSAAALLTLTASFSYFNHHVLRLPRNSGLLVIAIVLSVGLRMVEAFFPGFQLAEIVRSEVGELDFSSLLLDGALAFLLFSGAVNADVRALIARRWTILALATVGVLLSTLVIGLGLFFLFQWLGLDVPIFYCLTFGALISPTDPVTVLSVIKGLGVPHSLQAVIEGESLFNDGIGIVLFTLFLAHASGSGGDFDFTAALLDFVREAGGGLVLGAITGAIAFFALRGIDEYNTELMITLALVSGTYGLALYLGVSGPVAVVVDGLILGSLGRRYATSENTNDYLHKFWSLTDEVLNALLFLLIGLEFSILDLGRETLIAAALAIPLALFARVFSISLASIPINLGAQHKLRTVTLLTWSGLRGGISVALALSLPESPYRDVLITCCYAIAVFTMVVQGLTLKPLVARLYGPPAGASATTGTEPPDPTR